MAASSDHAAWLVFLAFMAIDCSCQEFTMSLDVDYEDFTCALNWTKRWKSVALINSSGGLQQSKTYIVYLIMYTYEFWKVNLTSQCNGTIRLYTDHSLVCAKVGETQYRVELNYSALAIHSEKHLKVTIEVDGQETNRKSAKLPLIQGRLRASFWVFDHQRDMGGVELNHSSSYNLLRVNASSFKQRQMNFCITNLKLPNVVRFGSNEVVARNVTESTACVVKDIDLDQRTAYQLTAEEFAYCRRKESWDLYLSGCDSLFKLNADGEALRYIGIDGGEPNHDLCFLRQGEEKWSAYFPLLVPEGCFKGEIRLDAVHPCTNQSKIVARISTESCQRGDEEFCVYKPYGREKWNVKRYQINVTQLANPELSEHHITVSVPPVEEYGVVMETRRLGVLPRIPRAINPTVQISGQNAFHKLWKEKHYVHFRDTNVENQQLTFCAASDEKTFNGEAATGHCVSGDVDMEVRTVYKLSYTEHDYCHRNASFTVFLTPCESFEYKPLAGQSTALTYREVPEDGRAGDEGEGSWRVDFVLDVPDDCFHDDITVTATPPRQSDKYSTVISTIKMSRCQEGEEKQCVYKAPPDLRENIRRYTVSISGDVTKQLSGHILTVKLSRIHEDMMPYKGTLGTLYVIDDSENPLFALSSQWIIVIFAAIIIIILSIVTYFMCGCKTEKFQPEPKKSARKGTKPSQCESHFSISSEISEAISSNKSSLQTSSQDQTSSISSASQKHKSRKKKSKYRKRQRNSSSKRENSLIANGHANESNITAGGNESESTMSDGGHKGKSHRKKHKHKKQHKKHRSGQEKASKRVKDGLESKSDILAEHELESRTVIEGQKKTSSETWRRIMNLSRLNSINSDKI